MRKIILTLTAFSMCLAVGCSEESATDFHETTPASTEIDPLAARSTAWSGEIGIESNGELIVTADQDALKADLTNTLIKEGYNTSVKTLSIEKLVASNDPTNTAYMLKGSDGIGTSIGVWLVRQNHQLTADLGFTNSTTCTGCAQGCNLSYVTIDGKKVAFCNENGCTYNCEKSESEF